jgi:cytochrome c oxidase subunit 2
MQKIVFVLTVGLLLSPLSAVAAVKTGGTCPKVGNVLIEKNKKYTCIKSGKRIIWSKAQRVSTSKTPAVNPGATTVSHDISIKGFQWSWEFGHKKGESQALVTGSPEQPPTLYLPQGERVNFTLISSDVSHGFWIPAFMIQMEMSPGANKSLQFTPSKLGEFPGRCNILCGRSHSEMLFNVKVVTPAQYQAYVASLA